MYSMKQLYLFHFRENLDVVILYTCFEIFFFFFSSTCKSNMEMWQLVYLEHPDKRNTLYKV